MASTVEKDGRASAAGAGGASCGAGLAAHPDAPASTSNPRPDARIPLMRDWILANRRRPARCRVAMTSPTQEHGTAHRSAIVPPQIGHIHPPIIGQRPNILGPQSALGGTVSAMCADDDLPTRARQS